MVSTVCFQLFQSLTPKDLVKAAKFLASPYFNLREDVQVVFKLFMETGTENLSQLSKQTVFERLFPGEPYDNLRLNYVLGFLAERLEQFMACEEMMMDPFQRQYLRCKAFRKRGLSRHFEKNAKELAQQHNALPLRNAQYWLESYQLECEVFAHQIMASRNAPNNLVAVVNALSHFITLENLRWASTEHSLSAISKKEIHTIPYIDAALAFTEKTGEPAAIMLKNSLEVLRNPNEVAAFDQLKSLMRQQSSLFSASEARDIYMSAINYCIRRHNQGETQYTKEALDLYKEALAKELLLENSLLSKYTYGNINNLAHLVGESDWAKSFLEDYKTSLPLAERENVYKYNIAIHHFRNSEYSLTLELLRNIEFSEVLINLDVRKMLVRSYFELGEWQALTSLLDSFRAYLRRLKKIGYHRESYLNLIKFTPRVEKVMRSNRAKRMLLAKRISETKYVAEREWLIRKLT